MKNYSKDSKDLLKKFKKKKKKLSIKDKGENLDQYNIFKQSQRFYELNENNYSSKKIF